MMSSRLVYIGAALGESIDPVEEIAAAIHVIMHLTGAETTDEQIAEALAICGVDATPDRIQRVRDAAYNMTDRKA